MIQVFECSACLLRLDLQSRMCAGVRVALESGARTAVTGCERPYLAVGIPCAREWLAHATKTMRFWGELWHSRG